MFAVRWHWEEGDRHLRILPRLWENDLNWAQWAQFGVHLATLWFVVMMLRFSRQMTNERLRQEELKTRKLMEAWDNASFDKRILQAADDWFDDKPNSKVLLREAVALKRRNQEMSDPTDRSDSK